MKKIQLLVSNNQLINNQINMLSMSEHDDLMKYVYELVDLSELNELEVFLKVMSGRNERWMHNGLNDAGNSSS